MLKLKKILNEIESSKNNLIIVDVQPEYSKSIGFNLELFFTEYVQQDWHNIYYK